MAKTSVILTQTSQIKDSTDSVLIEVDREYISDLITAAQKAEVTINALTNTTDLTSKQLTGDGFPEGCFVVFDLRQLTVKVDAFLTQLSALLQDGYQIGLINNLSKYSDDEIKKLKLYKIYLINSGQENTNQDATISDNKISDINGKLAKNRSLVDFRDFTNVPSPTAGARVGIGKDTSGLQGGPAIGYSTNGRDFYAAITPYGFTFRKRDAENMWRLLKPKQRDDIDSAVGDTVRKEVAKQQEGLSDAVSQASEAVQRADEAVEKSIVASDAAASMSDAISEAKSDAQNATNIANAMKSSVTDQLKNLDSTSKELDNARSEMTQYAKTAQDQGKDIADLKKSTAEITADVANTKGDVAELKINASATAVMASNNKSDITQLQVTASDASIDLQNAKSDIASFNATADKINASIKDQDGRISTVEQTAKGIQATIGNQQNDINTIKQDATGMKETITNNQKQLTEINTSVDGLSTKVAGAVGKDFVESSIKQANDKINESITSINGNIQNITADLNGVQATVKNKADVSQITQLTNLISTKVNQDDYKSAITQLGDDINARVQKGDLISQINLEAGQTLIESKKLFLDADSVVFSGKAFIPDAAIANLSLDKLTTGHITIPLTDKFGNEIELGREGIEISSLYSSIDRKEPDSSANSTDSSASSNQTDNNAVQAASLMTSFAAIANQSDDSGGSSSNGNIPDQPDNPDHPDTYTTSTSYRMRLTADGLRMIQRVHYKNDRDGKENDRDFTELQVSPVNAVGAETTDGANGLAFVTGVDDNDYTTGNQPASFLALGNGKKTNEKGTTLHHLDVIYSATSRSGYPAGMNVNTHLHILPPGADHGIRTAWVSWSRWDNGERYPAIVQDGTNWGGICFPKSGQVTLFDCFGHYYSPDKNSGMKNYSSYGG